MTALIQARKEAGLKQSDLAKKLGFRQQDVSKYENCIRRLDIVEFLEVCRILNIEYKALLDEVKTSAKK